VTARAAAVSNMFDEDDEALPFDAEFELAAVAASDTDFEAPPEIDDEPLPFDVAFEIALHSAAEEEAEQDSSEVLGVDLAKMPAFQEELAERAARAVALTQDLGAARRRRALQFDTGDVWCPAGRQTVVTLSPQCRWRSEKIMATDSSSSPGMGTMIVNVAVGQHIQKPGNGNGSLTKFFNQTSLADGIRFDTADAWEDIAITVYFITACTFNATLFGTAELE
jgi:hypothetical protein